MSTLKLYSLITSGFSSVIRITGAALFVVYCSVHFWFNGISAESVFSIDFVVGQVTTGPFIAVILYGGYWLQHSNLSEERYPRIGVWFLGGLGGFLLLNLVMIAVWPADATYNNIAWALFAAIAGGAIGLGIGLFEARAISRAVTAERNRVKREELEQRNEQLERFASIVSHDLRNPLNVATGRLALARETHAEEHIDAVASAHDRMETIIDRTLTLARSGQSVEDTHPVDLATVAESSWENVPTADATLEIDN